MPTRPRIDMTGYHHIINRGVDQIMLNISIKKQKEQVIFGKIIINQVVF